MTVVKPSNVERAGWPDATRVYVEALERDAARLDWLLEGLTDAELYEMIGERAFDRGWRKNVTELRRAIDEAMMEC